MNDASRPLAMSLDGRRFSYEVSVDALDVGVGRHVVLDFVGLGRLRSDADAAAAARYAAVPGAVDVRRATSAGGNRLHVRFRDFDADERAAVLHLDPIADPRGSRWWRARSSPARPSADSARVGPRRAARTSPRHGPPRGADRYFSSRESRRSLSTLPPVWHSGQ